MSRKTKKCKVGYLSLEGDRKKILNRFNTIGLTFPGAEDNIFWEHHMPFKLNSKGIDWLIAKVDGLDVIGIDPLRPLIPGDYIAPKDMSTFVQNLRQVENDTGCVIILTHHIRKPDRRYKVHPEDLIFEVKGASEVVEAATTVLLMDKGQQKRGEYGKFTSIDPKERSLYFVKVKDAPMDYAPVNLQFNEDKLIFEPITNFYEEEIFE